MEVCVSYQNLGIRNVPGLEFYFIYGIIFLFGIMLNIFLCIQYYENDKTILGNRNTFNFIMRSLNFTDLIMSVLLFVNLFIVKYVEFTNSPYSVIFYTPRNVIMAFEVILLTFMALDRLLAVISPITRKWNVSNMKKVFLFYFVFMGFWDAISSSLSSMPTKISCDLKTYLKSIYLTTYGVGSIFLLATTNFMYIFLFIFFLWRTKKSMKIGNVPKMTQKTNDLKSFQKIIKFGRLLFIITFLYTINLIPIFLSNSRLVRNMSFLLFYSFYLCVIINPTIFISGNNFVKTKIRNVLQKGIMIFRPWDLT